MQVTSNKLYEPIAVVNVTRALTMPVLLSTTLALLTSPRWQHDQGDIEHFASKSRFRSFVLLLGPQDRGGCNLLFASKGACEGGKGHRIRLHHQRGPFFLFVFLFFFFPFPKKSSSRLPKMLGHGKQLRPFRRNSEDLEVKLHYTSA